MGRFFVWMDKPDPGIPDTSWSGFLDAMAALTLVIVLVGVVTAVGLYTFSAGRKKIFSVDDVFAPYTPMRWLLLAVPAGLLAGGMCLHEYSSILGSSEGQIGVSLQIAVVNLLLTLLISYAVVLSDNKLTPAKFRYRPAPFLHRKKSAGASAG